MDELPRGFPRVSDEQKELWPTYIHACERAELLGLPIPNEEEWNETQRLETHEGDDDNAVIQNLDTSDEAAQRISGGLDELNTILNVTQKKINRFKTVCGSVGTLLKVRVGYRNHTPDHKSTERNHNKTKEIQDDTPMNDETMTVELSDDKSSMENTKSDMVKPKVIDITEKIGSHLDKLDSLINKGQNASYSMQHQTKQMKKFLK